MKRAQQEVGERYDRLTRLDQREQSAATIGSSYSPTCFVQVRVS